jgi:hypothetical protein
MFEFERVIFLRVMRKAGREMCVRNVRARGGFRRQGEKSGESEEGARELEGRERRRDLDRRLRRKAERERSEEI